MAGDDLGQAFDHRGELLDQHIGDARVQLSPPAPEHRGVGGVLHQRVLERVGRLGRRSAPGDQAGGRQPLERRVELRRRQARHRGNQRVGEFASDRGADLRHVLGRGEPVEARHQRGLQRRRYRERRQRSVEHVAVRHLTQQPALEQRAGQFLDEQRHAVGVRENLLDDGVGQRLVPGDAGNDAGAVAAAKAAQRHHRHMRLADPGRLELRPDRDDQQHRQVGGAGNRSVEQIERCRIDPVGVLEHDQHGALRRSAVELVEQGGERHLPLLLRADRQCRIALVRRHSQQLGDERDIAWQISRRRLEQGREPVELCSGAAARFEIRRPLELRDERMRARCAHGGESRNSAGAYAARPRAWPAGFRRYATCRCRARPKAARPGPHRAWPAPNGAAAARSAPGGRRAGSARPRAAPRTG